MTFRSGGEPSTAKTFVNILEFKIGIPKKKPHKIIRVYKHYVNKTPGKSNK